MLKLTKRELHRILRVEKDKIIWNTTSKKNKCAECYRNGHKCIKYLGTNYKYADIYKSLTNEFFNITEDSIVDYTINYNLPTNNDFIYRAISQLNNKFKYDALTNKFFAIKQKDELRLITIDNIDYIYLVLAFFPTNKVLDLWKNNGMQIKNFKPYVIEETKNNDITSIENKKEFNTNKPFKFSSIIEEYIEIDKYFALDLLHKHRQSVKISYKKDNDDMVFAKLVGINLDPEYNKTPFILKSYNNTIYNVFNINKVFIKNTNNISNEYAYNEVMNIFENKE